MLPVAADGAPLATPLMYNDPVGDTAILERIAVHAPKESAAHGATSGLAKLLTFQSLPEVFRVIHQADWIAGHFTGLYDISDENNALKTGYDPVARNWPEWLARTGARIDLLPDVLPAGRRSRRSRLPRRKPSACRAKPLSSRVRRMAALLSLRPGLTGRVTP